MMPVVLGRLRDGSHSAAEQIGFSRRRPALRVLYRFDGLLKLGRYIALPQFVRSPRLLGRGPFVREEQDAAETAARGFPDFADPLYCVVRRSDDRAPAPDQSVHRHLFDRLTRVFFELYVGS